MKLHVNLKENSYDIIMEKGVLYHLEDYINLDCKVMIISDTGVPESYAKTVKEQCKEGYIHIVEQGEESKSLEVFQDICNDLLQHNFSRKDLIIALGGGVVGDLSGFVAASYMRGITFIQIPTTTLSQIDSSVGGKVAVNLDSVKNVIGAFYQPKMVFVDVETLQTLPRRQYVNGLVEALKAGLIYDKELFALFEEDNIDAHLEEIIERALRVKIDVVEKDEKEQNLRKILNFGHTIGHAIESYYKLSQYLHGECVAMGMLYFIEDPAIKERVIKIYKKLKLVESAPYDVDKVYDLLRMDKKASGDSVTIVSVKELGVATLETMKLDEIKQYLRGN